MITGIEALSIGLKFPKKIVLNGSYKFLKNDFRKYVGTLNVDGLCRFHLKSDSGIAKRCFTI